MVNVERDKEEINVIYAKDLDNFLARFSLKENFYQGKIACKFCKEFVTSENIYSLLPDSGMLNLICDKSSCIIELFEYLNEKRKITSKA